MSLHDRGDNDQVVITNCRPIFFHFFTQLNGGRVWRHKCHVPKPHFSSLLLNAGLDTSPSATLDQRIIIKRFLSPRVPQLHRQLRSYPTHPCPSRSFVGKVWCFRLFPKWECHTLAQYPK